MSVGVSVVDVGTEVAVRVGDSVLDFEGESVSVCPAVEDSTAVEPLVGVGVSVAVGVCVDGCAVSVDAAVSVWSSVSWRQPVRLLEPTSPSATNSSLRCDFTANPQRGSL